MENMQIFVSAMEKIVYPGSISCGKNTCAGREESCIHKRFQKRMMGKYVVAALIAFIVLGVFSAGTVYACSFIQRKIYVTNTGLVIDDRETVQQMTIEETLDETAVYHNYVDAESSSTVEQSGSIVEENVKMQFFDNWEEALQDIPFAVAVPDIKEREEIEMSIIYQDNTSQDGTTYVSATYQDEQMEVIYRVTSYVGTKGWSVRHSYSGKIYEQYEYVNAYGYQFSLVRNESPIDKKERTYAVIALEWYEVQVEFCGFTREEIETVLDSIDLSVYKGGYK